MGHPMEEYYEAERREDDRRWERIHKMRAMLPTLPMSAFVASDAFHICAVMEPAILEKASDKDAKLDAALGRLEDVVASRTKPPRKPGQRRAKKSGSARRRQR